MRERGVLTRAALAVVACNPAADPVPTEDAAARPSAAMPSATAPAASGWPLASATTDAAPAQECPGDMVLVAGDACSAVVHRCEEWIERGRDRCRRYSADARCAGTLRPLRFCIDRYEYPNRAGELPVVMKSWLDAEATCKADGKRLCQSAEWTLACEGAERRPYPYGSTRDASACNIDRRYREPDFGAFADPERVGAEVLRLDQRVASGALARCVSPFGVHDLTGNVDEWVVNESGKPDVSGLKGGYWGPIRARCQPMTTAHNRWFRFYQVGFRCCADPGGNAGQH